MRLNRIRFANYRGIPDFEANLHEALVLVGPNDSGKSSLLAGLHILLGTHGQHLQGSFSHGDFTDLAKEIAIDAYLGNFTDDERAAFPDEISVVNGEEHLRIRLTARTNDADPDLIQVDREFPESDLGHRLSGEQLSAIGWEFVSASRSLYRELGGSRGGVLRSLLGSVNLGDEQVTLDAAVSALSEALDGLDALDGFREQIAQALSETLPRQVDKDSVRIALGTDFSADPLSGAQIGLGGPTSQRSLNEQSDGVRALAVLAAYGIAHSNANIVAIDEPEMHLHPAAQRSVAQLLRAGRAQVLVATHSSHVAAQFAPNEVAAIRPDAGFSQLPVAADAAEFRFAARWWQDQFVEPLTARCLVAVEGACERILLNSIGDLLGLRLHHRGVHVFDLGGAGQFVNANAVFGAPGFGIRFVGLVDEDHRGQWANVLNLHPADLEANGFRVCDPDLEGVLVASLGAARVIQLLVASGRFAEPSILASVGAANQISATDQAVADYLRSHKVKAAAVLASTMTVTDAQLLTPLVEVLQEATV